MSQMTSHDNPMTPQKHKRNGKSDVASSTHINPLQEGEDTPGLAVLQTWGKYKNASV